VNIIFGIWNNWLLLAFAAPFFWAAVNVIDLYFVMEAYEDEYEGAIITGFFQIIPAVAILSRGIPTADNKIILLALFGGVFFFLAMFFYFKALFVVDDISLLQVLWNLVAIFVPCMAFLLLDEKLTLIQYAGIFVTFLGAGLMSANKKLRRSNYSKIILIMLGAIFFLSLSMVIQDKVYSSTDFWSGLLIFCFGNVLGSICLLLLKKRNNIGHILHLNKKYFGWFLMTEMITIAGVLCAQRTIDRSPSVSFVAVIESFQPAFILMISALSFVFFTLFSLKKREIMKNIYEEQLVGIGSKFIAIVLMGFGIYLINM
jgi:drug/metabolite transporter (DMT)-like permease